MGISVRESRGVYLLSGELDWTVGEDLSFTTGWKLEGPDELVVDLSDITFIDSMGVRALVQLSKKCRGGLVLRYPQDIVVNVLELFEIDEMPGIRLQLA